MSSVERVASRYREKQAASPTKYWTKIKWGSLMATWANVTAPYWTASDASKFWHGVGKEVGRATQNKVRQRTPIELPVDMGNGVWAFEWRWGTTHDDPNADEGTLLDEAFVYADYIGNAINNVGKSLRLHGGYAQDTQDPRKLDLPPGW